MTDYSMNYIFTSYEIVASSNLGFGGATPFALVGSGHQWSSKIIQSLSRNSGNTSVTNDQNYDQKIDI